MRNIFHHIKWNTMFVLFTKCTLESKTKRTIFFHMDWRCNNKCSHVNKITELKLNAKRHNLEWTEILYFMELRSLPERTTADGL